MTIARYEEIDGVLTPTDERSLGSTPVSATLPIGSYLCVLKAPGKRDTRYPVMIERDKTWKGSVALKTDEEVGEEFVHVPAGEFIYGEGKETETKNLPDFAVARYPVTFADYAEYMESLDEEEAAVRLPRTDGDGPYMEKGDDGRYRPKSIIVEGKAHDECAERFGENYLEKDPRHGHRLGRRQRLLRVEDEDDGQGVAPAHRGGVGEGGTRRRRPAL